MDPNGKGNCGITSSGLRPVENLRLSTRLSVTMKTVSINGSGTSGNQAIFEIGPSESSWGFPTWRPNYRRQSSTPAPCGRTKVPYISKCRYLTKGGQRVLVWTESIDDRYRNELRSQAMEEARNPRKPYPHWGFDDSRFLEFDVNPTMAWCVCVSSSVIAQI